MNLDPPPSSVDLVDNTTSDSIWKTWFNNLYEIASEQVTRSLQISNLGKGTTAPTQAIIGNYTGWEYTIGDDSVFTFRVPENWVVGTDIIINSDWAINEAYATASGEVRFRIVWSAIPHDSTEAINGAGTTINSDDIDIPATAYFLTSNALTIVGSSFSTGDQIGITLSRIALTAGVNPTAEPAILGIHVTYTANELGLI